jgi:hypothetical protein
MGRHPQQRETRLRRLIGRLSYANIAATLALFLALTGTATAALVLPRDSVGSEQIQADAVRSSEIQADAVRSSEILDESIVLADLAPGARTALDAPRVRVDAADVVTQELPSCGYMPDCSNLLAVHLPAGRWLVQAKLAVTGLRPTNCGLVQSDTTIVDDAPTIGQYNGMTTEQVSLMAVLTTALGVEATTVGLRCEEYRQSDAIFWSKGKLIATEVKDEAQEG